MKGIRSSQTEITYATSGIKYGEVTAERGVLLSEEEWVLVARDELRATSGEVSAFRFRFFASRGRMQLTFTSIKSSSVSSAEEVEKRRINNTTDFLNPSLRDVTGM